MTVKRFAGLETEFGILAPQDLGANATVLSARLINAHADLVARERHHVAATSWDYADERPLQDARGFEMDRDAADPSQLTDQPRELTAEEIALSYDAQPGKIFKEEASMLAAMYREDANEIGHVRMNMVLGNGARFYVDHAHPEYSSPETLWPGDAVLWDQAGDVIARRAADHVRDAWDLGELLVYKNNTDGKGQSYGAHENYLMPREVDFEKTAGALIPFFVSRQVTCGAGRVGIGTRSGYPGFQISQRADFFEAEIGLETTVRRPIINTRDEPHSNWEKFRRLHVIIGDANMGQVSTYLRVGTTSLVLALIEAGRAPQIALQDPIEALQQISHDPQARAVVRLKDGRRVTAVDIQKIYYDAASSLCAETGADKEPQTADVLARWGATLDALARDPFEVAGTVDWVAKYQLLSAYRERNGLAWDDARLAMMDLQWSDLRRDKGLYFKLLERERMERLFDDATIERAAVQPPEDTRAYLRGRAVSEFPDHVVGANWDALSFSVPGRARVQRRSLLDPFWGSRATVEELFEMQTDIAEFVDALPRGDRGA